MNKFFLKKIFKKFSFISLLFFALPIIVNAQETQKIAWVKKFQNAGNVTKIAAIASDKNDNTIVLLNAKKNNKQNSYIILRNENGKKEWRVLLNKNNDTKVIGQDLSIDDDGNIYVLWIVEQGFSKQKFIAKYNLNGKKQWEKILSDVDANTILQKILVDKSNNIFVLGTNFAQEINVVLYKFDFSGNTLFERRYTHLGFGKSSVDRSIIAKMDRDENIYIAGQTIVQSKDLLLRSPFILKVNIHGDLLFKELINISEYNLFLSGIDIDKQENIYLVGSVLYSGFRTEVSTEFQQENEVVKVKKYSLMSGYQDYFILKFNAKENKKEWVRTYGANQHTNNIDDLKVYENQILVIGHSSENLNKNNKSIEKHNIFIKSYNAS